MQPGTDPLEALILTQALPSYFWDQGKSTLGLVPSTASLAVCAHTRSVQSFLEHYGSFELATKNNSHRVNKPWHSFYSVSSLCPAPVPDPLINFSVCKRETLHQKGVSSYLWFLLCGICSDPSVRCSKTKCFPYQNLLFLSYSQDPASIVQLNICRQWSDAFSLQ